MIRTFGFGLLGGLLALAFTLPASAAEPVGLHGATRIGVDLQKPFLYLLPATGTAPLTFAAQNLPVGLTLDAKTGIISGVATTAGTTTSHVMLADQFGSVTRDLQFVVGENVMAITPIMAWNPWYVWGCNIDDKKIRQAADLLVSTGLAAHGYSYINLDDCWQGTRDANGEIQPNARFPDMKALSDYVHGKGLHIGIYTSPNTKTCAGYMGSAGHLEQDVATFAKWGMDLVKYDWCGATGDEPTTYQAMSTALAKSPRAIVHLMCQYGVDNVWEWGAQVGGNSWRTDNDLADTWESIQRNGFENINLARYASAGHFNDLDMLMVGKANWPKELGEYSISNAPPRESQLTYDEKLTHITLWSMLASPLIFSGDLAQVDADTYSQLTNDDILAIDQDALAAPVTRISEDDGTQVLTRALADGSLAVALFNLNANATSVHVGIAQLPLADGAVVQVRDLWTHMVAQTDRTGTLIEVVPAHGVVLLKVSAH